MFACRDTMDYIPPMNRLPALLLTLVLAACASAPQRTYTASNEQMNDLVMYAMSLTDTQYRYGGNSADSGFDCSGFVGHVYRHMLGVSLPRTAREISRVGATVGRNELRPGDLVFYNTQHASFSHVGIYIGEGKFVHSPKTGDSVRTEQMQLNYWQSRFDGARRIAR